MVAHAKITTNSCCKSAAAAAAARTRHAVAILRPVTTTVAARCKPSTATAVSRNSGTSKGRIRRRVEVRRKMETLRSLMPGAGEGTEEDGGRLDGKELLFRAADYIVRLQLQVKVMQFMVDVLEHGKD